MIRWAMLLGGAAGVVAMGLVIDAQSRIHVDRSRDVPASSLISATGRVEGVAPAIPLRFHLAGHVQEILVREGQVVERGDLLLRLDDRQYRHEVALALAQLQLAEAELERLRNGARAEERAEAGALYKAKQAESERARLSWERISTLLDGGAISQEEADSTRTRFAGLAAEVEAAWARTQLLNAPAREDEVLIAEARINAARARVALATTYLDRCELRAPGPSQVLKLHVEPGEFTGPDAVQPPAIIADTSRPHVRAFVEEMDAPRVELDMPATITVDGLPGRQFTGHIHRVSPQMSRKELWSDAPGERFDTKVREVWIELSSAERLVVGLRVDVLIDPDGGPRGPE